MEENDKIGTRIGFFSLDFLETASHLSQSVGPVCRAGRAGLASEIRRFCRENRRAQNAHEMTGFEISKFVKVIQEIMFVLFTITYFS